MKDSLISHPLHDYLPLLAKHRSVAALKKSLLYQSIQKEIELALNSLESGSYALPLSYFKKDFCRMVSWDLSGETDYDEALAFFKGHPLLMRADVLFLTSVDNGLLRTGNRNWSQSFARDLRMNYLFSPFSLHLGVGNSVGFTGSAILSSYTLENGHFHCLENNPDSLQALWSRKVLVADVDFPYNKVTAACHHFLNSFSDRQRAQEMNKILIWLTQAIYPLLIGGTLSGDAKKVVSVFNEFDLDTYLKCKDFAGRGIAVADPKFGAVFPEVIPHISWDEKFISQAVILDIQ